MKDKIKYKLRNCKKIYHIISDVYFVVRKYYYTIALMIFRIFKIDNNKVMVISYFGKGYGDNGKYIAESLLKCKPDIKLYWATYDSNKGSLPKQINYCKYGSIAYLFHLATSKVWINNCRFELGIIKRKQQYYIQTWHSSLRLKVIEKDAIDNLNKKYIKSAQNDSKMCDLIISGSQISSDIYKNSFWYDGEVIETGTPRCDLFFNEGFKNEYRELICKEYNVDVSKKIVLYAPTFRDYSNFESLDLNKLKNMIGENYTLMLRFHPKVNINVNEDSDIINVTKYPDIQQLICACDYFITDYSGCCFDAMYANKPVILYVPDLNEYLKRERKLYFDFEQLPFLKTSSYEEVGNIIMNFDSEKYNQNINEFKGSIGLKEDGNAAARISTLILKKIEGDNYEKI